MKYEFEFTPAPRDLRSIGNIQKRRREGPPSFSSGSSDNEAFINDSLTRADWIRADDGEFSIVSRESGSDELRMDPLTGYPHGEGYHLTTEIQNTQVSVTIEHASLRGLKYALSTLAGLMIGKGGYKELVPEIDIVDGPRFPIRGLIEGYYGPPWSSEARKGLLELMADHRMNAYFYGPKDDKYHRDFWRDPYEGKALKELTSLINMAAERDMDFWYTIGPGLSMAYSSEEDFVKLLGKLSQLSDLGVSRFGLLYDDIPDQLQHEDDRMKYESLPDAHAAVANRLFRSLKEKDAGIRLAVCPTLYHGNGNEPYITALGGLLDPRIDMFWTGPEICSRQLTLSDTSFLARNIDRPVLFWDNYPVNDCQMTRELHIGPYRGRDPHLYRSSLGVVANGMEHPESSKIGLLTVADYLWNPESYDPEKSWEHALQTVIGAGQWEDFRIFADNNRYSCLYTTDSPDLIKALESMIFLRYRNDREGVITALRETVERLKRANRLFDSGMENRALQGEILRWIEKFAKGVRLLEAVLTYLEEPGDAGKTALNQAMDEYSSDNTYVFADVLDEIAANFLGE